MAKDKNKNKNQKTQIEKVKARTEKAVEAAKEGDKQEAKKYMQNAEKAADKAKKQKLAKKIIKNARQDIKNSRRPSVRPPQMAPSPVPPSSITPPAPTTSSVKQVEASVILFDQENVPAEVMADLIFEDIGGLELINTARQDSIDGQDIIYSPIKLLSIFNRQFDPNDLIAGQRTDSLFLNQFALKIANILPADGAVYVDNETGDLVITVEDLPQDQLIQIEILSDGTIYKIGEQ